MIMEYGNILEEQTASIYSEDRDNKIHEYGQYL